MIKEVKVNKLIVKLCFLHKFNKNLHTTCDKYFNDKKRMFRLEIIDFFRS
jgi:hypothetical protein